MSGLLDDKGRYRPGGELGTVESQQFNVHLNALHDGLSIFTSNKLPGIIKVLNRCGVLSLNNSELVLLLNVLGSILKENGFLFDAVHKISQEVTDRLRQSGALADSDVRIDESCARVTIGDIEPVLSKPITIKWPGSKVATTYVYQAIDSVFSSIMRARNILTTVKSEGIHWSNSPNDRQSNEVNGVLEGIEKFLDDILSILQKAREEEEIRKYGRIVQEMETDGAEQAANVEKGILAKSEEERIAKEFEQKTKIRRRLTMGAVGLVALVGSYLGDVFGVRTYIGNRFDYALSRLQGDSERQSNIKAQINSCLKGNSVCEGKTSILLSHHSDISVSEILEIYSNDRNSILPTISSLEQTSKVQGVDILGNYESFKIVLSEDGALESVEFIYPSGKFSHIRGIKFQNQEGHIRAFTLMVIDNNSGDGRDGASDIIDFAASVLSQQTPTGGLIIPGFSLPDYHFIGGDALRKRVQDFAIASAKKGDNMSGRVDATMPLIRPYVPHILSSTQGTWINFLLSIAVIIIESQGSSTVKSHKGVEGLTQVTKGTGGDFVMQRICENGPCENGLESLVNDWVHPLISISTKVSYFNFILKDIMPTVAEYRVNGNMLSDLERLALVATAYNIGQGKLIKIIKTIGNSDINAILGHLSANRGEGSGKYGETHDYVLRFLGVFEELRPQMISVLNEVNGHGIYEAYLVEFSYSNGDIRLKDLEELISSYSKEKQLDTEDLLARFKILNPHLYVGGLVRGVPIPKQTGAKERGVRVYFPDEGSRELFRNQYNGNLINPRFEDLKLDKTRTSVSHIDPAYFEAVDRYTIGDTLPEVLMSSIVSKFIIPEGSDQNSIYQESVGMFASLQRLVGLRDFYLQKRDYSSLKQTFANLNGDPKKIAEAESGEQFKIAGELKILATWYLKTVNHKRSVIRDLQESSVFALRGRDGKGLTPEERNVLDAYNVFDAILPVISALINDMVRTDGAYNRFTNSVAMLVEIAELKMLKSAMEKELKDLKIRERKQVSQLGLQGVSFNLAGLSANDFGISDDMNWEGTYTYRFA